MKYKQHAGQPTIKTQYMKPIQSLFQMYRQWMSQLVAEVRYVMVMHTMKHILSMCKIAITLDPSPPLREARHCYLLTTLCLEQYHKEYAFQHITAMDETQASSHKAKLKWQSNEWHHPVTHPKKLCQDPRNVKVIPRCQAACSFTGPNCQCTELPQVPEDHPVLQKQPYLLHTTNNCGAWQSCDHQARWQCRTLEEHPPYSKDMSDFDLFP